MLLDWQMHRGVRREVKVRAIVLVMVTIALTIWITKHTFWISATIAMCAMIGITIIARLPTIGNSSRNAQIKVKEPSE
jgi:uncharacterized membrane protein YbaN (DUF454 family)